MDTYNPLLVDHVQRMHRERNGEVHPPHYLALARVDRPTSPAHVPQRMRSASRGINLDSLSARLAKSGINLDSLSARSGQLVKAFWPVPAGFAFFVVLRSIIGG